MLQPALSNTVLCTPQHYFVLPVYSPTPFCVVCVLSNIILCYLCILQHHFVLSVYNPTLFSVVCVLFNATLCCSCILQHYFVLFVYVLPVYCLTLTTAVDLAEQGHLSQNQNTFIGPVEAHMEIYLTVHSNKRNK